MDILIKNMEMPKNYPYRLTLHSDGHVEDHSGYSGHGHYQAIELPEHGDLIDRDDVLNELKTHYKVGEVAEVGEVACFIEEAEVVLERTT